MADKSAVPIFTASCRPPQSLLSPLPELLRTPSGLALLELQGTINLPTHDFDTPTTELQVSGNEASQEIPIGRLIFPDYHPQTQDSHSMAWMKRVYLYVGKHQRLTGEVKKLPKAIAVIRKRSAEDHDGSGVTATKPGEDQAEELEIVEIVKWKILFSQRPEPVGTWSGEA